MKEIRDRYEIFLKVCETGSFSSVTAMWAPDMIRCFRENYPGVTVEILDGNYDEIRAWLLHGQADCGFLSSIVADGLKFVPLWDDPLRAVFPPGHPLESRETVTLLELFAYPLIIETPGCDNDIRHLLAKCPVKPDISYSFRDDTLIMAFVRASLGVTISQQLVMDAFSHDLVTRSLSPTSCRMIGLAFARTTNSVEAQALLAYMQQRLA